ncbi:hypothetical protein, partial [Achromobacter ruhlandii]|uniref:hypothetical protein n=1 Tax=Achromobacter ruhlandii TaxID=72557 RepID=UPI001B8B713E
LEHRSLVPASDRKVWGIFGDGRAALWNPVKNAAVAIRCRSACGRVSRRGLPYQMLLRATVRKAALS